MTALIAILLAASSVGNDIEAVVSPIGTLPAGWVYLPDERIDSVPGIYHDRVSGACVTMDLAWPSVVSPTPAKDADVGQASGVRYHRRYEKSKECLNGEALVVSFFPDGEQATSLVWHFGAELCGPEQRQRVTDLLFSKARIGLPLDPPQYPANLPTVPEVTAFKPGTSVTEVVAKLGTPRSSSCEKGGRFMVGYAARHGKSYREWDALFDAKQSFVRVKRRHPGY
jgi:hypothetical protein